MRSATAIAIALLLLARTVGASDPIPWSEAGSHAGQNVTVEGDVAAASSTPDQLVLEFAPGDTSAFRVVLIIPMMTDLPRFPERLYQGKRIRASGVVQRFRGRPEMVLRSPGQIEIVDVAGPASAPAVVAPPPTTPAPATVAPAPAPSPPPAPPVVPAAPVAAPVTPPATVPAPAAPPASVAVPAFPTTTLPAAVPPPAAAAPSTTVPPPPPAPRAEPPTSTLPAPTTISVPPPPSPLEVLAERRCTRAQERWQEAARRASGLAADLQRCLAAGSYHCRAAAAAMAPALSEVEWAEQQVSDTCP